MFVNYFAIRMLLYLLFRDVTLRAVSSTHRNPQTGGGNVMAKVEIQIPKGLGLTRKQVSDLQKSFQKQLVDTLRGKQKSAKASPKLMVVDVRAKSKSEVV